MPNRIVPLAVAGALALLSGGIASPAMADAPCHTVSVTATADHLLHLPTHIAAGATRFRVSGASSEDNIQLARPKGSAGAQQLADDGNLLNTKGDASGIERDFTAVGGSSVGTSFWVRLHPGTYYAIDTDAEVATAASVVTIHVRGDAAAGRMPRATTTIAAIHDMDWAPRPTHIPSNGVLRFVNASTDYHFVELARLTSDHTTLAQLKAALASDDESIADGTYYDTGVLSPGLQQESTYNLPKGLYGLLCWWPDENGVPHALMGMVRLIRVG